MKQRLPPPEIAHPPFSPAPFHAFSKYFSLKILVIACETSLSRVLKVSRKCERLCVCFPSGPPVRCVSPVCVCFPAVFRNVQEFCAHEWLHLLNARAPASFPIHEPSRYPSATPFALTLVSLPCPHIRWTTRGISSDAPNFPRLAEACGDRSGPSKARMWPLVVRLLPQGSTSLFKDLSICS